MLQFTLPVLGAIFVWWFSTGLVLYLVGLPRRTHRWTLLGACGALALALWGLTNCATDATETGAYTAFAWAVVAWGWQEICFLTGIAAGPRTTRCPQGLTGWRRFGAAVQAILFHELQLLVLGAAVVLATSGGANQVGLWTYLLLWMMRLSAKLNLFLGVPFLHADWLPLELRYLASYFRVRPMNWLFPVSVSVATIVVVLLVQSSLASDAGPFDVAQRLLLAALLGLAVLEHWFMVLPLPVMALWWGFKPRGTAKAVVFSTPTIDRRGT
jgi:putative photosynthetic complex assembly protein 2